MKIKTNRLILRPFQDADRLINAQIFADPEVRRFALGTFDREAANARLDRAIAEYDDEGKGSGRTDGTDAEAIDTREIPDLQIE